MTDMTRGVIQAYLDGFNSYPHIEDKLQEEIQDLKERMLAFADNNPDITSFYSKLAESGLQKEYTRLITKLAMASMEGENQGKSQEKDQEEGFSPMSVSDFLDQYRPAYEEVKKSGFRKRGEAAYEKIFQLADRTQDMLEAQIIMEKKRLLWQIVVEDSLDLFQPVLEGMDPLQPTTIGLEKQIQVYKNASSSEELDYRLERLEIEKLVLVQNATSKINLVARLASLLMGYWASKLNSQTSGGQGEMGQKHLYSMIAFRKAAQRTLGFMENKLNMTLEDIFVDEGLKIWLLSPENMDELGRIKTSLNPQNYEVIKDIVYNEILSDLSILDLLKRPSDKIIWFGLEGSQKEEFQSRAKEKADRLNAFLTYYVSKEEFQEVREECTGLF